MARIPGLIRRADRHYAIRVRVPDAIQPIIGRKEVWESLGTSDPIEAKKRHAAAHMRIRTQFESAARHDPLTADDVQALAQDHYAETLATDEQRRMRDDVSQLAQFNARTLDGREHGLRDALVNHHVEQVAPGEFVSNTDALVGALADSILVRNGFRADPDSQEYRQLCKQLLRVELELVQRSRERDKGDFAGKPADPVLANIAAKAKLTPRLSAVIESFEEGKRTSGEWDTKTQKIQGGRLKTCLELISDKRIGDITPDDMEQFRKDIQRVPASFRSRATKGTARQAIAKTNGAKTLSTATANMHIGVIKSVFIYADNKGLIDKSPAKIIGEMKNDAARRKPFTDDDLRTMFKPGNKKAGDGPAYHWVPRILLYTGARLEEICQLHAEDIKQLHGVWVFDINRDGSKRLKTKQSERYIPVHSALIKLGLLKFAHNKTGHLFPELEFGANGYSTNFSKRMGRYIRAIGITDPLKVASHSFRHTLSTRLGGAGVTGQTIDQLMGWHSNGNQRARYTHEFELKTLQAAIEKFAVVRID